MFSQKRNKGLFLFFTLNFYFLHLLKLFIVACSFFLASFPLFAHSASFLSLFENKELRRRSVQIPVWTMKSRLLFKAVVILK